MQIKVKTKPFLLISSLLLAGLFVFTIGIDIKSSLEKISSSDIKNQVVSVLGEPALAEDMYPMFFCPCCGEPLDKKNICCEMAQERIDYIDSMVVKGMPEKEIQLEYVKKYGLNSFIDATKGEALKEELAKSAPVNRPQIAITPDYKDLGDISEKGGEMYAFFDVENKGKTDLVINKMDTSCGCTSSAIVFNGKEGPRFAMAGHGVESPTNWSVSIPPGAKAQLKIYYDPTVHEGFRGPATREVYIYSDDPINFETKITIDLNQVD